jgi:hypothetical protein
MRSRSSSTKLRGQRTLRVEQLEARLPFAVDGFATDFMAPLDIPNAVGNDTFSLDLIGGGRRGRCNLASVPQTGSQQSLKVKLRKVTFA